VRKERRKIGENMIEIKIVSWERSKVNRKQKIELKLFSR